MVNDVPTKLNDVQIYDTDVIEIEMEFIEGPCSDPQPLTPTFSKYVFVQIFLADSLVWRNNSQICAKSMLALRNSNTMVSLQQCSVTCT